MKNLIDKLKLVGGKTIACQCFSSHYSLTNCPNNCNMVPNVNSILCYTFCYFLLVLSGAGWENTIKDGAHCNTATGENEHWSGGSQESRSESIGNEPFSVPSNQQMFCTVNVRIRLHNIFVFHNGHHARLGIQTAIDFLLCHGQEIGSTTSLTSTNHSGGKIQQILTW